MAYMHELNLDILDNDNEFCFELQRTSLHGEQMKNSAEKCLQVLIQ